MYKRTALSLPLFDSALFHSRYHDDFVTSAGGSEGDVIELPTSLERFEANFNAFTFTERPIRTKKKTACSTSSQYQSLLVVGQCIAEIGSAMPDRVFSHYLSYMNRLADLMRSAETLEMPYFASTTHEPPPAKKPSPSAVEEPSPSPVDETPPIVVIEPSPFHASNPSSPVVFSDFIAKSNPLFKLQNDSLDIIRNGEMLSDDVIDSACALLMRQFPKFSTQTTCNSQSMFGKVTTTGKELYAQIHHLPTRVHFVLSVLHGDSIQIFDSCEKFILCSQLKKQLSEIYPKMCTNFDLVPSPQQKGALDCGVFAIANLVEYLMGSSIENVEYDQEKMRNHLVQCLKNQKMTKFPKKRGRKRVNELNVKMIEVIDSRVVNVNDLSTDLNFETSCKSKGRKKVAKTRHYSAKFNKV